MIRLLLLLSFLSLLAPCRGAFAQNCTNSNTDENIIEYFNLINYMGDYTIQTMSGRNGFYSLSITCPPEQSSSMPPADFQLQIKTITGNLQTSCYDLDPLTIKPTNENCNRNGECTFIVIVDNKSTKKIYSQTEIKVPLRNNFMENPELNPASLPICLSTITPCLTENECSLEQDSSSLGLSGQETYSYHEEVNFKLDLDNS